MLYRHYLVSDSSSDTTGVAGVHYSKDNCGNHISISSMGSLVLSRAVWY